MSTQYLVIERIYELFSHNILTTTTTYKNGSIILTHQVLEDSFIMKLLNNRSSTVAVGRVISATNTADTDRFYISKLPDEAPTQIDRHTFNTVLADQEKSKMHVSEEVFEEYLSINSQGQLSHAWVTITKENGASRKATIEFSSAEERQLFILPEWLAPIT